MFLLHNIIDPLGTVCYTIQEQGRVKKIGVEREEEQRPRSSGITREGRGMGRDGERGGEGSAN